MRPKLSPPMYSMIRLSIECSSGTMGLVFVASGGVNVEGGSSRRGVSEYKIGMARALFSCSRI